MEAHHARVVAAEDTIRAQAWAMSQATVEGHHVTGVRSVRLQRPGTERRLPEYLVLLSVDPQRRLKGCDCE